MQVMMSSHLNKDTFLVMVQANEQGEIKKVAPYEYNKEEPLAYPDKKDFPYTDEPLRIYKNTETGISVTKCGEIVGTVQNIEEDFPIVLFIRFYIKEENEQDEFGLVSKIEKDVPFIDSLEFTFDVKGASNVATGEKIDSEYIFSIYNSMDSDPDFWSNLAKELLSEYLLTKAALETK